MKRMVWTLCMMLGITSSLQAAENYKTFPVSDQVTVEKVRFKNGGRHVLAQGA